MLTNMNARAHRLLWSAIAVALGMGVAHAATAQVVLTGRVVDDLSERPLQGARVLLLNRYNKTAGYAVTGDSGRFRFERSDYGLYRLDIKAPGFEPAVTPLLWILEGRDFADLEVRLAPHAVLLAPLEVVAMSDLGTSPVLENMMQRRLTGFGYQITKDDIAKRNPRAISDMLVELPGVYAGGSGTANNSRSIYMGRALPSGGAGCPVQVYLDGVLASRGPGEDVLIDDLVHPLDVEAIEVFRGLSSIPPEFLTPDARCGVIAIWTKRSMEQRP